MAEIDPPFGRSVGCDPSRSRGRLHTEPASASRTVFQRDRDRIIHSTAFRRLTYKTQVFVYHEGDHYRTRMTHSIEVAQIARTLARRLVLNEDLAEAISLAHDLGHPPFGHTGERAIAGALADFGGFDHNVQSLRVVTLLERKYAAFDGLNLSWETLEGMVKHNGPLLSTTNGADCLPASIASYNRQHDLMLDRYASAEAQLVALADDIAYCNHDLDDALRAGLIDFEMLAALAATADVLDDVAARHGRIDPSRRIHEINRRLIGAMVDDLVAETARRIKSFDARCADDVRMADGPVAAFSAPMRERISEIRAFLFKRVYRHPRVVTVMDDAERIVRDLISMYLTDSSALPKDWADAARACQADQRVQLISDFVAGMTDRFALHEHQRLFDATPELR